MLSDLRVKAAQFDASIGGGELPADGCLRLIAALLPGGDFRGDLFPAAEPPAQAVTAEHRKLALRHVQPGAVLRRVVPLEARGETPGFGGKEALVEGGGGVGVEIVGHQHDLLDVRIALIGEQPQLLGEIKGGAAFGYRHLTLARQRLDAEKQVAGSVARIFIILAFRRPGLRRQAAPGRGAEGLGALVQADDRALRVIGAVIHVEHIFHFGDEGSRRLGNAPGFHLPGLDRVFFNRLPTATWEMESRQPSATSRSASSRSVQWSWPSGGSLQASTVSWASISPVILGARPVRGFSERAASRPSARKR